MMLTKVEDGLGMTCVRGKLVWADPLPPFPPILTIPTITHHTYPPYHIHHCIPYLLCLLSPPLLCTIRTLHPTHHYILTHTTISKCRYQYQTHHLSTNYATHYLQYRPNSAITHSRQLFWCVFF